MIFPFEFKDGVLPHISRFFQWETYYGVIEGVPDKEINNDNIQHQKMLAKQHCNLDAIYLVEPKRNAFTNANGSEKETLPRITCIAALINYNPVSDLDKECSRLALIWFQDDFAFPVDEDIVRQIIQIEWNKHAIDEYL